MIQREFYWFTDLQLCGHNRNLGLCNIYIVSQFTKGSSFKVKALKALRQSLGVDENIMPRLVDAQGLELFVMFGSILELNHMFLSFIS